MCEWARYPQQTVPTVYEERLGNQLYAVAAVPFDSCGKGCSNLRPVVTGWTLEAYRETFPEVPPFVDRNWFTGIWRGEVSFADARESWRLQNLLLKASAAGEVAAVAQAVRGLDRVIATYNATDGDIPLVLREYGADIVAPAYSEWGADSGTSYMWFVAQLTIQGGGPLAILPTVRAAAWVGWRKAPGVME